MKTYQAQIALLNLIFAAAAVKAFVVPTLPRRTPLRRQSCSTRLFAIVDEVSDEMKKAMKAKDTTRLATLRLIRSAFANAQIEFKTDKLTDDQAVDALRKMAKMRKESIDMYEKGGAKDRAAAEQAELDILEAWLPSLADEEQTRIWVQEAMKEAGDQKNVGKVMGALMKAHKGQVDGSIAQKVVKEEISKL